MFHNLNGMKNHKIVNNATTTEAIRKHRLGTLRILDFQVFD